MKRDRSPVTSGEWTPQLGYALVAVLGLVWLVPFLWMTVAAFRPESLGAAGMASLLPDYLPTLDNFRQAWNLADFPRYYLNTIVICGGILAVQVTTMSLAAFAFARLQFPGRTTLFYLFLVQLMLVPIVLLVPT